MTLSSTPRSFVFLCVVSLILWWHTLVATFALALQKDAYTHILLIIPFSVALILSDRKWRLARPEPNLRTGSVLLVLAVLIGFMGDAWGRASRVSSDVQLSLSMLAVVTWWIGAIVCCFGNRIFRMCAFPLCFLLWLVPIPGFVLNRIVSFLQQGSASAAHVLFAIARVPVVQDGVVLFTPGQSLEVAKECSSIRSSLMLLVTCMVLAQFLLRTAWGKIFVVLAAIPFSIAKNGFRIFTLSMIGMYVDPDVLNGPLHHHGGIVFFVFALAGLFLLLRLTGWAERKTAAKPAVGYVGAGAKDQSLTPSCDDAVKNTTALLSG